MNEAVIYCVRNGHQYMMSGWHVICGITVAVILLGAGYLFGKSRNNNE